MLLLHIQKKNDEERKSLLTFFYIRNQFSISTAQAKTSMFVSLKRPSHVTSLHMRVPIQTTCSSYNQYFNECAKRIEEQNIA